MLIAQGTITEQRTKTEQGFSDTEEDEEAPEMTMKRQGNDNSSIEE